MNVAIGADHAGFALKEWLVGELRKEGVLLQDIGAHDTAPSDYPDFAEGVALLVTKGKAERGIVVCGSGVGAAVAANKVRGARAAVAHDTYTAHQGVEHDDINILCLGSRVIGNALALEVIHAFLGARFLNEERFQRRLKKVLEIESRGE